MTLLKPILIVCGSLALALGAVGLALPVFPTTPFIILAAACFAGSSPKLYAWLEHSRIFGAFIVNYRTKSGVPRKTKLAALIFLWSMLALSAFFSKRLWVMGILLVVGIGVSVHILLIKTADPPNQ
ncbi:MAG: YbaN family protein [Oscillospiraceae bacterium]